MRARQAKVALGWLVAAVLATSTASTPWGCIANPNRIEATRLDGTKIVLWFKGDKYFHWYEDAVGYTALRRSDGFYVHAALDATGSIVPTGSRVGLDDPAASSLAPGILPTDDVRRESIAKVLPTPPGDSARSAFRAIAHPLRK